MTEQEEDQKLIKSIQEAPDRKVFYVDVGDMPEEEVRKHLEKALGRDIHFKKENDDTSR